VLLHTVMLPSIPIGYAAHMTETYENMKDLLQYINNEQYNWQRYGDFKVITILLGFQPDYTKYCCFCVNGTVVQDMNITLRRTGQK